MSNKNLKSIFGLLSILFWITTFLTIFAWLMALYIHIGLCIDPFFWGIPIGGNIIQIFLFVSMMYVDSKIDK